MIIIICKFVCRNEMMCLVPWILRWKFNKKDLKNGLSRFIRKMDQKGLKKNRRRRNTLNESWINCVSLILRSTVKPLHFSDTILGFTETLTMLSNKIFVGIRSKCILFYDTICVEALKCKCIHWSGLYSIWSLLKIFKKYYFKAALSKIVLLPFFNYTFGNLLRLLLN